MESDPIVFELAAAATHRPRPLRALTFIQRRTTFSNPVWFECEDNEVYVVKGQNAGRAIFNEQVIARLGTAMHAPVATPALVMIPEELVQNEPQLSDIAPGIAHGTLLIKDTSDRQWLAHTDKGYNRPRFALLSILYGWLCANDHQLIYVNHEPCLVYSVDHGHFFPGGPNWTVAQFANAPEAQPYEELRNGCGLLDIEIEDALRALHRVSVTNIIEAVAFPPDQWGVDMDERVALTRFLITRQAHMLRTLSS